MSINEIINLSLDKNDKKTLDNVFNNLKNNNIDLNFEVYNELINNEIIEHICSNITKKGNINIYINDINIYQLLNLYCDNNEINFNEESSQFDNDIFNSYLKYIKSNELNVLSKEEEKELLIKCKKGDKKARDKFLMHNLRLVIKAAKKYYKSDIGIDLMELVEEGNLGLIRAFESFDESLEFKFSTYALYWINQRIDRFIKNNSRNIRLPIYYIRKISELKKSISELTNILKRTPTLNEISEYTNYTTDEILEIFKNNEQIISLNETVKDEDNDTTYLEFVRDISNTASDNVIKNKIDRMFLEEKMKKLTKKQQAVIRLKYGFDDGMPKTLEETGKILNVSRERTRQLESKAIERINYLIEIEEKKEKRFKRR